MPSAQASPIQLSPLQQQLLQRIVRRTTSAQRLVKRGQIILEAAEGPATVKLLNTGRSIMKRCGVGGIAGTRRSHGCKRSKRQASRNS